MEGRPTLAEWPEAGYRKWKRGVRRSRLRRHLFQGGGQALNPRCFIEAWLYHLCPLSMHSTCTDWVWSIRRGPVGLLHRVDGVNCCGPDEVSQVQSDLLNPLLMSRLSVWAAYSPSGSRRATWQRSKWECSRPRAACRRAAAWGAPAGRPGSLAPDSSQRLVVGHCPSGVGWASSPTSTSSTRPLRTAQITSSCFVPMPSLSCMR